MGRRAALGAALAAALFVVGAEPSGEAEAQLGMPGPDPRFAGLQWTFVRVKYNAHIAPNSGYRFDYWGEPWAIDAPAAEQNLSRRLKTVTAIEVGEPIVLTLEDPRLWEYPWLYFVEPGNLRLTEAEVPILREFLLRGGTAMFDDFHGPYEWENLESELRRVFPDRRIVDLPPTHPIYTAFYTIDVYPQVPGLGSFFRGRTWEKGGFVAQLRAVVDDRERPMVLINWNTDMGDGWEWSNAEEYPGYIRHTRDAYRMAINEIVYALTH